MKSFYYFFALLSATAAVSASSHNTQQFVCSGDNDVCQGGAQTGQKVDATVSVPPPIRRRSVLDLFRLAAQKRALATVKDYANAVAGHALPGNVVAAAKQAGWIPPAHIARGLLEGTLDERAMKAGAAGAKKGSEAALPPEKVAAHVASGGAIPHEVISAALAAGWTKPGGKTAGKGGRSRANVAKPGKGRRDGIYAREAKLSRKQIHGLLEKMEDDPQLEKFVVNAINNDPDAEEFTEHLAEKWLKSREVIPAEILAKRDAIALAEANPEAYFEQFEERDAFPEAEPEADPEAYFEERDAEPELYFRERDAKPEAYFEERDAEPELYFGERDAEPEVYFEERDADPESHFYGDTFSY